MRRAILVLVLVMALAPATALAGGLSVLAGFQSVSFGADLGEYYDLPAGLAPAIIVGLDLGFPIDINLGQRKTDEGNSGQEAIYTWMEIGPRFLMGREGASIRPDFFVGVGSYDLEIGSLTFDTAMGGYAGFGVEEFASEKWSGRFQVKGVYWKSDTYNTDAAVLNVALLFGYHF